MQTQLDLQTNQLATEAVPCRSRIAFAISIYLANWPVIDFLYASSLGLAFLAALISSRSVTLWKIQRDGCVTYGLDRLYMHFG